MQKMNGLLVKSSPPKGSGTGSLSPAERMRLTRKRRASGLLLVPVEVRDNELDTLIRERLLSPADRGNKAAVREALHRFFDIAM